ncbi:PGPGW domain-containing protein [Nocardioides sp. TRM66260-LWL]|uniref:PGPGW domain-containing protein n=1 Tax=Nocardioides sp. TRM66260-LWL TaxID=2874478 RepID=UPI001CC4F2C2|nr:PGPGW domain-containing protein [Nocardioides sp. TRM66260-LWL]MBZ5735771.1 PGPGW domain-containing protein [Nocardioides sp. TRM66260-LWL]
MNAARRVALEIVGWGLLVAGVAALVLPGPGLLMIFAALAVLSQQYEWAERRLDPVKYRALKGAAESVETWPRIVASTVFALALIPAGVLWISQPDVPSWWPVHERWWLPGGVATGTTQIASALIALGLIVYSYRRFHGRPEAVAELARETARADEAYRAG